MAAEEKKNILVIDDDITIRKLIGFNLKRKDYNVFEAQDSVEGMNYLESEKIDLVLCDVSMDGVDGYTFCQEVRKNEKYRVLPFIFVTGKSSFEDKEKALDVGGDDIITKPFDVQELLIKVQSLIKRADIYKIYGAKKSFERAITTEESSLILLVDDDLSLSKLFEYNLKKSGFSCIIANNVKDGFKLAKEKQPDIIISDIMMPDVDGYEFRRMLLNDDDLKAIPFIFLTSKGGEEDILEGYDLEIADYVIKTAGPRVVVAKVSAIAKSLGKARQKVVSEFHKAADSLRVKVVPDNFPTFSGFEIKHWHQPFQGIPGGDFIDYFNLDENTFAVVLGDVMGKKWGAWYFAIAYAGYVRSSIRGALQSSSNIYSSKNILESVNTSIYQDAKISEVFATLSIVLINKLTNEIDYSGAGDLPVIYKNHQTGEATLIKSKGMLLGFAADGNFESSIIKLNKGDSVFLITDGIIDSRNTEGVSLGTEAIAQIISEIPKDADILDHLKKYMENFTGNKYDDDVSVIAIKLN